VTRFGLAGLACSVLAVAVLAGCSSAGAEHDVFTVFAPSPMA
jgi:hypothetical protein